MAGEQLEFLSLILAGVLAYGIKIIIDRGVMTLLTPLLRRCHLTCLVRWVSRRSDTPDSGSDTPGDTPGDTWTTEVIGDGALIVGKPTSTTIRIPQMVRIGKDQDQGHGDPDGPPVRGQRATAETIRAWVVRQREHGWSRAETLAEGQQLFSVSESTMVRRYRDATGDLR
jgi:hypothetical protein